MSHHVESFASVPYARLSVLDARNLLLVPPPPAFSSSVHFIKTLICSRIFHVIFFSPISEGACAVTLALYLPCSRFGTRDQEGFGLFSHSLERLSLPSSNFRFSFFRRNFKVFFVPAAFFLDFPEEGSRISLSLLHRIAAL